MPMSRSMRVAREVYSYRRCSALVIQQRVIVESPKDAHPVHDAAFTGISYEMESAVGSSFLGIWGDIHYLPLGNPLANP